MVKLFLFLYLFGVPEVYQLCFACTVTLEHMVSPGQTFLAWTTCITLYVAGRLSSMFQIVLDSTSILTLLPRIRGGRMHLSMSK